VLCARCQQDNPRGAKFCNACGVSLAVACADCGHRNPPGSRFCNECGHALDVAARPRLHTGPAVTADTASVLSVRMVGANRALEGERKQVTVLFADVKGSMELLADRDPEEARKLLDPVIERMMDAVRRYEGTVNQILGDGIMALFGAPLAHEDHAVRACYAALTMHEAVGQYAAELRRTAGIDVQIRVGINAGEVVVRAVRSDLHVEYSAVGQTTHLAARMEQLARPGTTLITGDTLRLVEGYVEVRALGPVPVKGLAQSIEVFELAGAGAARSRLQASAVRGLSRFVGRERELAELGAASARAAAGHGQMVSIVGEPGVGKSRLAWEFKHSLDPGGWLVVESSSVSYGKATPHLPLVDLLKGYFDVEPRADARTVQEKVTGRVLTLDRSLENILPALLTLLDAGADDAGEPRAEGRARRRAIAEAVTRLLLRQAAVRPLLVIFEDLHWLDAETQAFLDVFVDCLPGARVLLLVNYRPEYRHAWGSQTYYAQLRLDPLPAATADELLGALLGGDPGLVPLKRLLVERTEGNPFFLEESVRTLLETRALDGAPGAYRLARVFETIQVPATVQTVLAARIDRLPPADKSLLQIAAVIGKDIPLPLLEAVAEGSADELSRSLARLRAAEFLYETSLFPDIEYTFKHALTHEVAYGSLLQERRREMHARVVDVFEALFPERVAERLHWLAHHAFRGEVWERALGYLRRTQSQPPPTLDAYFGGAESVGYLWWTGDYERAITTGTRELAIASNFANFALTVVANFRLGQIHHSLGDYARASGHLARAAGPLQAELLYETCDLAGLPSVFARAWLALCRAEQGDLAEARRLATEAVTIAEAGEHAYSLIVACSALGNVQLVVGEIPEAVAVLERGVVLAGVQQVPLLLPFVASPLGAAYALAGRLDDGLPLLEQAVADAAAMKLNANQPARLVRLAAGLRCAGRRERAHAVAAHALDVARQQKERGHEAHALWLAGELARDETGRALEAAERSYRQASELAARLGMRTLLGRCRLGLAFTHRLAHREREADDELAAADELLRATGTTFWLAHAEAA
jgi:class 3 adenylate cyclase/tetratricopeptide (TPR) repeat protein